jgi:type VI protein secretion system component VasF
MKEELIDHIKNQLADFDQGYTEGAWESFRDKNERRKKLALWVRMAGAAAILLIAIILLPSKLSKDQNLIYKEIITSKKSEGRHILSTVIAPLKQLKPAPPTCGLPCRPNI